MSTRCQVKVIQEGVGWKKEVTLYHHTDGYPEHMIPCIHKAMGYEDEYCKGMNWEKGRAGKVASFLCWSDPGTFEPEEGHNLHGDIEYYYKLYCVNSYQGSSKENPKWEVEVYCPKNGFWDAPEEQNLRIKIERISLDELVREYKKEE